MNAIQMISIFACGFALGLILYILLEKLFVPEVDYDDYELSRLQEKKNKTIETVSVNSRISPKQNFINGKLGLSNSGGYKNKDSSLNNLKSKIFELKKGNKITL